jgi:hypothetical protein
MSASEKTPSEAAESINGFDEIAIGAHFGMKLASMKEDPYTFLRALVFVDKRRGGLKDKEAFQEAMEQTIGDLGRYFVAEDGVEDPAGEGEGSAA